MQRGFTERIPQSNKRIKVPPAPDPRQWKRTKAWRRKGDRKRLREIQRESRIPHIQTQQKLGQAERLSHFLLTYKRDWCGCLYQWVCMSCLPLSHCAWMCWLLFLGIHEHRLIFARATTRVLDPGDAVSRAQKALRYLWGEQPVRSPPVRELSGYHSLLEEPDAHWTHFSNVLWNRGCRQRSFLIFSTELPRLLLSFSEVILQGSSKYQTPKSEMDNSPGGKSTIWHLNIACLIWYY